MTRDELLQIVDANTIDWDAYTTVRDAIDEYTAGGKEGESPLQDFINEVEHMQKMYGNQRYTQAEKCRDELAEKLDDIMRLGGNNR